MKVLHISNNDNSGAGLCAYRICKSLQQNGIDSRMLVLKKTTNDATIQAAFSKRYYVYRVFHALLRKMGIYVFEYDKLVKQTQENHAPYTRPVTPFDLSNHPWVRNADIIHLHWVDDFFNQVTFLRKVQKPIVWTLHDEGFFYGTGHYHDATYEGDKLDAKYRQIKREMLSGTSNLTIVFLSQYFERNFRDSPLLVGHKTTIINNSVDCAKFVRYNKQEARHRLGLAMDVKYFSFLANNITDAHKNLVALISALDKIGKNNYQILAIGDNSLFGGDKRVEDVGIIRDCELMSLYLSASDYFVMPSLQEAFSQAPIEAMACGIPIIVFPVSGTEELITKDTGVICEDFTVEALQKAIEIALHTKYDSARIRKYVVDRFSPQIIAEKYINLYKSLLP